MTECLRYTLEIAGLTARLMDEKGCDCILLSGGVDTGFLAVASRLYGRGLERAYTIVDGSSRDYSLSASLAGALGVKHRTILLSKPLVLPAIDMALAALRTVDPVEIAGAATVALGLAIALGDGCRCIVTGDGGDELFLGYSFLLDAPAERLAVWRRQMAGGRAFFNSRPLSKELEVGLCTPLYHESVRRASLRIPLDCLIGRGPDGRRAGKLVLRLLLDYAGFPGHAWQEKRPITSGSGILGVLEEVAAGAERVEGWEPSSLHAYLLARMRRLGLSYPGPCNDEPRRCPICGRCLEGDRCPFCGAYLGGGGVSVYRGFSKGSRS